MQPSEKREHVEAPSTEVTEISRRRVGADVGQLMRISQGSAWNIDAAVWDREDWVNIPAELRDALREVMRQLARTSCSRFDVRFVKHG